MRESIEKRLSRMENDLTKLIERQQAMFRALAIFHTGSHMFSATVNRVTMLTSRVDSLQTEMFGIMSFAAIGISAALAGLALKELWVRIFGEVVLALAVAGLIHLRVRLSRVKKELEQTRSELDRWEHEREALESEAASVDEVFHDREEES